MDVRELPLGQLLARTRWDTHASGFAFDRKKTSLLAEQAQAFIAEQSLCVIAGPGPQAELLPSPSSVLPGLFAYRRPLPLLGLHVRQAFFHCPKYIKTRISGRARVLEVRELPAEVAHNCPGAERGSSANSAACSATKRRLVYSPCI